MTIPRCHHLAGFGTIARSEMHVFCDTSATAKRFVIYLCQANTEGDTAVCFLYGSSKVAPRAANSIPRLELYAAEEASRAGAKTLGEIDFPIESSTFYSDIKIVLGYLTNTSRSFQRYVTSKVALILRLNKKERWRYIPSEENPADIALRSQSPANLKSSH